MRSRAPLSGIRVLELGSFIAGPYCGQLLADYGAEVIKVEPPREGDAMRRWGVALYQGRSLWWPVIARGKKSVTVDLRHPDGQELVRRLADRCDVLVENFRPGTLEGWGLGPDVLLERNPALVYVRISAFGQAGPYRDRPGFGAVAEAMGGLRYLVGYPDRPPPRFGISIGDTLAGMFGALGALLALREREVRGGRGQVVDVAITDAVLAVLESVIAECSVTGAVRERSGTVLPGVAPSNLYETADGRWVVVAANADGVFRRLCDAMGRPEWKADPRYATHEARGAHQAELDQAIAQWVRSLPAEELLGVLDRHGVPCGPVYNAAEVLADPHYRARGALVEVDNPGVGRVTMQGPVPRLAETPLPVPGPAPELGEHTDHVLKELLGLSAEDVARLREAGVV
ncbi:MAG: CaiB/BaiF CoA-transferase family protein [Armatimonadota bacterium]|nr:CaiB/BaiF CoA-transferase family protein [Armatimonadota bacterium]MDR7390036.1 CaiB/BaiF CoA-transferase family protein [Armatimonadota bacterium]MDR7392264.1 CaiB/BaiF CoA-transferase family protein [Armatimonadota bacterium]MDR7394214.1 CaiB/BaiF CoA-transferase family protein [Armatimonadota bacterium]MDR7396414.1 CaiB/BaiF CoA-transferase family protein [Armatimonadota bacterium]